MGFLKMNKTYCSAAFCHIYSDSKGQYKLCCHAYDHLNELKKFNSKTHTPFEYFLSDELEDIRNRMLSGEKIGGCEKCYELEDAGFQSPRIFRYHSDKITMFEPRDIELKLRIFGNNCNLACYMCIPFNSSTRTRELKEMGIFDEISKGKVFDADITKDQWEKMYQEILDNIHMVGDIHLTGGEPFLLHKHYKFIKSIPDEHAKHIHLTYDTNFTNIKYKGKYIFEYLEKFKSAVFNISCDHYGDKLSWIRYPIDVQQFEDNIRYFQNNTPKNMKINRLNCTVSILNVEDLDAIKDYYRHNFDLDVNFNNIVNTPYYLNIKNHPRKKELIEKYRSNPEYSQAIVRLERPAVMDQWNYGIDYIKKLDDHRKTQFEKLWPNYIKVNSLEVD